MLVMTTILFGSNLHGRVADWGSYFILALGLIALVVAPLSFPLLVLALLSFVPRDRKWIMRTPEDAIVP